MSELKPHHIVYNSRMHDFFFYVKDWRVSTNGTSSRKNVDLITLPYLLESIDSAQHKEGYKFNSVGQTWLPPQLRGELEARPAIGEKKSITVFHIHNYHDEWVSYGILNMVRFIYRKW